MEEGEFLLYKFEQQIGRESYRIGRAREGCAAQIQFEFSDRGEKVLLSAELRTGPDLTPTHFTLDGKTCRQAEVHREVEVRPDRVRVRDRDSWTEFPRPQRFFTIEGYAPLALQMLLLQYWREHGSPDSLAKFPSGSVRVKRRGEDSFGPSGASVTLERFSVEGLLWGRETVWTDPGGSLAAAVTIDAEFDHFEALRPGLESHLGEFVRRAGADGMAAFADLADRFAPERTGPLVIAHARLIDGTGRPPIPDSAVLVDGGRIEAVGPFARVPIPTGAAVLDASGRTVLAGLWDMHAHFQQVEWGPVYLAAGVTTVRDCANEFEFITSVRDAIAAGQGLGPRIVAAGVVDGPGPLMVGVARVESPEDAEAWVERYHAAGFAQIKVYSSIRLEALEAITRSAHRRGMTVTGHVPEGITVEQAVRAGMDQINHVHFLLGSIAGPFAEGASRDDRLRAVASVDLDSPRARDLLALLRQHGTVIDPTLAVLELSTVSTAKPAISFEPGSAKVPSEIGGRLASPGPPSERTALQEQAFRKCLAMVGALHRAGVPIVAGTDQAVPGHSLHREIELYVEAGLAPSEALRSATVVPATILGLTDESGTVEAGKRADLVIVDGNPLERISDIRRVTTVLANGRPYSPADLWTSVGFRP